VSHIYCWVTGQPHSSPTDTCQIRRLRTRIRGLRVLRVLGFRIRGSLFETFSDDKGLEFVAFETSGSYALEFEAPCSRPSPTTKGSNSWPPRPKSPRPSNSRPCPRPKNPGSDILSTEIQSSNANSQILS
jgi:hypothetical protein